jgi:hypothetical protein
MMRFVERDRAAICSKKPAQRWKKLSSLLADLELCGSVSTQLKEDIFRVMVIKGDMKIFSPKRKSEGMM